MNDAKQHRRSGKLFSKEALDPAAKVTCDSGGRGERDSPGGRTGVCRRVEGSPLSFLPQRDLSFGDIFLALESVHCVGVGRIPPFLFAENSPFFILFFESCFEL